MLKALGKVREVFKAKNTDKLKNFIYSLNPSITYEKHCECIQLKTFLGGVRQAIFGNHTVGVEIGSLFTQLMLLVFITSSASDHKTEEAYIYFHLIPQWVQVAILSVSCLAIIWSFICPKYSAKVIGSYGLLWSGAVFSLVSIAFAAAAPPMNLGSLLFPAMAVICFTAGNSKMVNLCIGFKQNSE